MDTDIEILDTNGNKPIKGSDLKGLLNNWLLKNPSRRRVGTPTLSFAIQQNGSNGTNHCCYFGYICFEHEPNPDYSDPAEE